jgi:hypothetical protein
LLWDWTLGEGSEDFLSSWFLIESMEEEEEWTRKRDKRKMVKEC